MEKNSKKLYCNLTKSAMVISHDHLVLPCCRFNPTKENNIPTILDLKNGDVLNGTFFSYLREKFSSGDFPDGCLTCEKEETASLKSMRQRRGMVEKENVQLEDLEFFVGNRCNMKCIMCGPELSSLWQSEISGSTEITEGSSLEDFKELDLSYLKSLRLLGGETLLNKSFIEIIHWIKSVATQGNIELSFATNGSVGKSTNLINLLKDFNSICIDFSIDGVENVAEKIRPGISWKFIEKNIREWIKIVNDFPQFEFNIHTTIQKDNIFHVDTIIDFCIQQNLPWSFTVLEYPKELSIQRLSSDDLIKAQEKLKKHSKTDIYEAYFVKRKKLDQWLFLTKNLTL